MGQRWTAGHDFAGKGGHFNMLAYVHPMTWEDVLRNRRARPEFSSPLVPFRLEYTELGKSSDSEEVSLSTEKKNM